MHRLVKLFKGKDMNIQIIFFVIIFSFCGLAKAEILPDCGLGKAEVLPVSTYEKNIICHALVNSQATKMMPGAPDDQVLSCRAEGFFARSDSGVYVVTVKSNDHGLLSCHAEIGPARNNSKTDVAELSNCMVSYPKPRMGGSN